MIHSIERLISYRVVLPPTTYKPLCIPVIAVVPSQHEPDPASIQPSIYLFHANDHLIGYPQESPFLSASLSTSHLVQSSSNDSLHEQGQKHCLSILRHPCRFGSSFPSTMRPCHITAPPPSDGGPPFSFTFLTLPSNDSTIKLF